MSILWRYTLQHYFRVFFLSVLTFIAVLIIARFKDIARFTALTGDFGKTGLFIVYHIPTILPIAIPISCLISSLLLFQGLSRSFELTALRSSGFSLWRILTPLLAASFFLSLLNFSLSAEIAPYCRRAAKPLVYEGTSSNPLLLLQRQKLVKIKNAFLHMKAENEETARDLTLIIPNEKTKRLSLISARRLLLGEKEELKGEDLAVISYLESEPGGFDTLLIENQSRMSTAAPLLSDALKRQRPKLDLNAFNLKMLFVSKQTQTAWVEFLRRISLSLSVFSFTWLGSVFGIQHGRGRSLKTLGWALGLTLLVLISYLLGKGLRNFSLYATLILLLPHPILWLATWTRMGRISRGRA